MGILYAGITHQGMRRQNNQDAILLDPDHFLFAVADGVGGGKCGDVASKMTLELLQKVVGPGRDSHTKMGLMRLVQEINTKVYSFAQSSPATQGMGTTLNSILFTKKETFIMNVGDSRTYLINDRLLYQLTRDHSLVQEKVNLGIYSRAEAKLDQMKNMIVRTIGFESHVDPDIFAYRPQKNDIFLCCSDGLHGMIPDSELIKMINQLIPAPEHCTEAQIQNAVQALVDQANNNGGDDNISVVLAVVI